MNILFVRHARPYDSDLLQDKNTNPDILESENKRMATLKQKYKHIKFDRVYFSPLERTKQTAEYLFEDELLVEKENIVEMDMGSLGGKKLNFGTWIKLIHFYFTNSSRYQSEKIEEFKHRSASAFRDIIYECMNKDFQDIAIVTHNGMMVAILKNLLGKVPWYKFKFSYLEDYMLEIDNPVDLIVKISSSDMLNN